MATTQKTPKEDAIKILKFISYIATAVAYIVTGKQIGRAHV